jgi:hypothetical protein
MDNLKDKILEKMKIEPELVYLAMMEQEREIKTMKDTFIKAINDEPEYPNEIPDEIFEKIKNDKDLITQALHLTIQITKDRIKERINLI